MLSSLELKILKEYIKAEPLRISVQRFPQLSELRYKEVIKAISEEKKIEFYKVETAANKFKSPEYRYIDDKGFITSEGKTAIYNYPKELAETIFTVYLPIILSIPAIVLSIISFFRK